MEKHVRLTESKCIKETPKALLVLVNGREMWMPRSQVVDTSDVQTEGDEGDLVVTSWIAEQKGLVGEALPF